MKSPAAIAILLLVLVNSVSGFPNFLPKNISSPPWASNILPKNISSPPWASFQNLTGCHMGDHVPGLADLKRYLKRFGYMNFPDNDTNSTNANVTDDFDDSLEWAIKTYQKNFNLNPTGSLDISTVNQIVRPRCGVPDIINGTTTMNSSGAAHANDRRLYSYFPGSPSWPSNKRQLTYAISPTDRISADDATLRSIFARAFERWSNVTQLTFVEAAEYSAADIKIGFYSGDHMYIKIPATAECIPSVKEVISHGISVNVTLIFSLSRYEAVVDAYLDGLEASGLSDLSKVTSVASFFVSRVDTLVDKMLEKIGTPEALDLRGKAAVAQAALAYKLYQKKFSGPRWEALVKKGAKKQRLLWASTSVKNPAYPDTLYVDPLIGPDTVSTMPDNALLAFVDHGTVSRTIDSNLSEAEGIYSALEKIGIDWSEVGSLLELEGVESFKKSFDSLLTSLQEKAASLKLVSL